MNEETLNIEVIDTGLIREKFAGTYIVESKNEVALVEVSTSHGVPQILKTLKNKKIEPDMVKYIIVTHIHLDHAGGAGLLLKNLPKAKIILHPSGSKHMIDPSKLIKGAIAVYGEEVVKKDYGEIIPIPEEKIIECKDGQIFSLGNTTLTTIYTPGHARHHISIFDSQSQGMFTGDSLGLSYPELTVGERRFYQPTTTPTAFEYDKMLDSIDKMMNFNPKHIYFTHFGKSSEPLYISQIIKKRLKDYKEIVESLINFENDQLELLEDKLRSYYITECKKHKIILPEYEISNIFDIDIKLNAMGLILWKKRELG
jgi:glyoxylase-like metal-dependent hydrolase (beta-lactamase superfamily II)